MATKLGIWNRALRRIGERRLSGVDEDSVTGRMVRDIYEDCKQEVLEMHSWKFARRMANLPLNSASPIEGYSNSFKLPADCIKVVYFNNTYPLDRQRIPFTTVGRDLHTNESVAKITYITKNAEEGSMTPGFAAALSLYIAMNAAFERTQSQPLMDRLAQMFDRQLKQAKRDDASQDMTPPPSSLSFPNISARFIGPRTHADGRH